jgi:hypothetical protein
MDDAVDLIVTGPKRLVGGKGFSADGGVTPPQVVT